ncbi:thioredoxin-dependent thiol peroxidase [Flavobacteriaceae bacterium]|jgi:peroxiredoxin Q/BCP|nr:thioredoxin-dependent thiol peroxidase [Flavobacteriaceae bacterium]|tara:strand:- start:3740 stop:4198 length:459 start_codon:yes stop_codon:yes gene_type:complete
MSLLKVGDKIPEFSCYDDKENLVTNNDLIGKKTIIFFYPRANTPGCTAQACNLSENFSKLTKIGFSIIGISADKIKSQSSFSSKFGGFPYPLLSDVDKKIINGFGVWGSKKFQGKEYEGILRTTFIINEDLEITRVIEKVKTKDHTNQILEK